MHKGSSKASANALGTSEHSDEHAVKSEGSAATRLLAALFNVSCHCGNIKLEVRAELADVVECNCSICVDITVSPFADLTANMHMSEPTHGTRECAEDADFDLI